MRTHLKALQDMGLLKIQLRKGTSNRYVLGVEAGFQSGVEAQFHRVRKLTSAYTKEKLKKKKGGLNDLAG